MDEVAVVPDRTPTAVLVPRGREEDVAVSVSTAGDLTAPVEPGQPAGAVSYRLGDEELTRVELVTDTGVERAGFFKRLWHTIVRFAQRIMA
jgi:D-alanyl-D-alanine carboxypeptidase (penicillin-binding protein 5/6)